MTMTNSRSLRICAQCLSQQYSLVAVGLVHLLYNPLCTGPALHELRATSLITTSLVPLSQSDTDWLYCGQGREEWQTQERELGH